MVEVRKIGLILFWARCTSTRELLRIWKSTWLLLQPPVKHLEVNVDAVNLGHHAGWRHYFEVHLLCSTLGEIYNYGPRATKMLDVRA
jgi:hypothetical protein